jgi:serine/threonine protein phosphatase PrpC
VTSKISQIFIAGPVDLAQFARKDAVGQRRLSTITLYPQKKLTEAQPEIVGVKPPSIVYGSLVFSSYYSSHPGTFGPPGIKVRQDDFALATELEGRRFYFSGIFDGHGTNGTHAVSLAKQRLMFRIGKASNPMDAKQITDAFVLTQQDLEVEIEKKSNNIIYNNFNNSSTQNCLRSLTTYLSTLLLLFVVNKIQSSAEDLSCSGLSCSVAIINERKIICASVGDCRAVLIYRDEQGKVRTLFCLKMYIFGFHCQD